LLFRQRGIVACGFRDAVAQFPVLLDASRYATHLKRWRAVFGRENVRPLFLETLASNPGLYAAQLCDCLDVPFQAVPPSLMRKVNAANSLPSCNLLARLARRTSEAAHGLGLHRAVRFAARSGLRSFCFGRPGAGRLPELSPDDAFWLASELEPEVEELEDLLCVKLPDWKPAAFK
jgi:hypothetical protein